MMHMENAPTRKVRGGNVEAMAIILIYEANHKVEILTRFEKVLKDGVVFGRSVGDRGNQILHDITRQRKLRENDQVGVLFPGLLDVVEVLFEICFDVPQFCSDLCKSKIEFHPPNLTTK